MKKLWIAFIVLATLGSIYPFNFQAVELDTVRIGSFLQTCCRMLGRGDILGNVILFIPVGFTGFLAGRAGTTAGRQFIHVCVVATVVALVLQLLQIFLPSRDENLQDVVWNLIGTACGVGLASMARASITSAENGKSDAALIPATLVGTWLIYRLIPFIPSIDFQLIKDSVKPIFSLQLNPVSVIHDVSAWSVVAYFLKEMQSGRRLDNWLPALMVAVFCLEVLIVDNEVNFSNLVGGLIAVLLWWSVLRDNRRQKGVLVILLFCTVAIMGLTPFEFRTEVAPFNWLPFQGFLGGSMYLNTQSAAEKIFLYGSLVYLLSKTYTSFFGSIIFSFSFVTIIEFAQTGLAGHTPEITDPLLLVFAAFALLALQKQEDKTALHSQAVSSFENGQLRRPRKPRTRRSGNSTGWTKQSVNFRDYQFEFLQRLSKEMGASVSATTRKIVARCMEKQEQIVTPSASVDLDDSIEVRRLSSDTKPGHPNVPQRWEKISVNFRRHQYEFLDRLSVEAGISISRVTRHLIADYIDGLENDDE